ncbi:uncharacterized protein LOC132733212 isoform X2 [Ruditapes philippinarum]|uniref:uncharacterized protein LOC132733212 isoform X2 n=1 Tax=Ruditapes philippinarum TaxID=129788 RepID=UPI00295C05AF|nr:uncharacterized protein LOC132733212 isoform X2 [Ruditapes philippinarum]
MADNAKIHPLSTPSEQSGVLQPPRTDNLYQENSKQGNAQQQPTAVVVTQPENADQAAARRPPNYLPCAILASCFCFLCGLYAIQDAVQANNLAAQGDMKAARSKANWARIEIIFSFVFGVAVIIAIIVVQSIYL